MTSPAADEQSFRDELATIDKQGRRIWVYPQRPKGRYFNARVILSFFLLAFLFGAPLTKVGGNPLLQFDILNRRFFIFGASFWPQDFHLFVLGGLALVVFIVLFTAIFGRLFCGWICPQTVFMEMLFRRIEHWIEGDFVRQKKFDKSPLTAGKFARKALKHAIFLGLSFLIGNTFLAYIVGFDALYVIVTDPPSQHVTGLVFMVLFTLVFYGVFARFREQACTMVCPYGRLQSVLLDLNSIVVAYDFKRGEPRAPLKKTVDRADKGDCVACNVCVHVCPTGIDIRNGTQLECVNCTACIDACDAVMRRVDKPTGLVRYASMNGITRGERFRVTPRIALYTTGLTLLTGLIVFLLVSRTDVETTILRATGSMFEQTDDGRIRNLYTVKVLNKTPDDKSIRLSLKGMEGEVKVLGPSLDIPGQGIGESVFAILIDPERLFTSSSLITIEVAAGDAVLEEVRTSFMGPSPSWNKHNP